MVTVFPPALLKPVPYSGRHSQHLGLSYFDVRSMFSPSGHCRVGENCVPKSRELHAAQHRGLHYRDQIAAAGFPRVHALILPPVQLLKTMFVKCFVSGMMGPSEMSNSL